MKEFFINKVKAFIEHNGLIDGSAPVLVALSGGADSVALLRVLLELGYDCRAAHCNFHLRGEESNRDERFVTQLCQRLGVTLHVKHFDVPAFMAQHGVSLEMACRTLRYEWFEHLRRELGCDCIAVAHHNDDNIETFFINALRGTGIAGLTGMRPRNGAVARPLLCNELYSESVGVMRNIVSDHEGDSLVIDLEILNSFTSREMLLFEILKPLGFNYDQCCDMLTSAVGRHFVTATHKAAINRNNIEVFPLKQDDAKVHVVDLEQDEIAEPVALEISHISGTPFTPAMVNGKTAVAFSLDIMQCSEVLLRHWRDGDRFKPFGMNGSKLISDLFTDLKLSEKQKNDTWLLEADGEILWVLGYRAAQAFAVPKAASNYLIVRMK